MAWLIWLTLLIAIILPDFSGEMRIRRTADLALFYWLIVVTALLLRPQNPRRLRSWWLIGAISFAIHVAVSFHEAHGWSHRAAVQHVDEVSGFGPGIFFSHALTLIWLIDAIWWSIAPNGYETRPIWMGRLLHGYMAFLIFNGTVVYETGMIRWVGALAFLGLGVLMWRGRLGIKPSTAAQ